MKIRTKVLLVILPLLILPLVLIGVTSYISARNGITRIAKEFLSYKAVELYKYCRRQEDILTETGLGDLQDYRDIARQSATEYAEALRLSDTGFFMVFDSRGEVQFPAEVSPSVADEPFFDRISQEPAGLITFTLNRVGRVGYYLYFEPWDWYILLSEQEAVFYQDAASIRRQLLYTLGITLVAAAGLILLFIRKLTRPIGNVVQTMKNIITSNDLSRRVRVEYDDEIGYLATWFNRMIGDLETAYNQVKKYAYRSVLAKTAEERIRQIFQKYVPGEIIDEVLHADSGKLLVGKKQTATILFSDIRSFTTISERLTAEQLINSLNTYFNVMVGIIIKHRGTIDKFIGDAIMAIYGAPVQHEDDPLEAVRTALEMVGSLGDFNRRQVRIGMPVFNIGIGLNTGEVVVGNIGSQQKLDYTCIGDAVNLASRLEGLTKMYGVPVIISQYTRVQAGEEISVRELDSVRVKGKKEPVKIYEPYAALGRSAGEGYELFNRGIQLYRGRRFSDAMELFKQSNRALQGDVPSSLYVERCKELIGNPPGKDWDGVFTAQTK
jgi:class 3 adenylate cyclase/HAMP domain-containing protein